jgi:hypothetical protein
MPDSTDKVILPFPAGFWQTRRRAFPGFEEFLSNVHSQIARPDQDTRRSQVNQR